ncbi:ABC transporter permease [Rhodococcus wratislaviensis]|uniref:Putative ABC transporter permease protein n=1 Tax=Rhodococcus wratislaviensis NBRC 100605 TaxID=1219028 RepID=X0PMI8_RHOWR|nr:ABC transporter permease [Rhodococcus wratislaviensis]GAF43678.1 putative ABC transporter permease protein [Rhodococcus wratislaviensis NBRC 100605]
MTADLTASTSATWPARLVRPQMGWVTLIAGLLFAAVLLMAALGGLIAPHDAAAQDLLRGATGPSAGHILGTDELGRDIFSRLIVGARTAVLGPLVIAVATTTLSTVLGLLAGYLGGWTDGVVGRLTDIVYALPPLLVAIVVVGILGGGLPLGVLVLVVLNIPAGYRSMRAATLEQRSLPYIETAKVLGEPKWRIMWHHVLPNVRPILYTTFFLSFTYGFVDLSTLSFLGLGVSPGTPDWGRMAAESRVLIFQNPWAVIAPLAMIVIAAVSANLVGQGLDRRTAGRNR